MSKQTAWLELFTGVVIDVPSDEAEAQKKTQKVQQSAAAIAGAQDAYALKKQAQLAALVVARNEFDKIKVDTQKVLSAKIDSGPFKGKSFLDVQNGQIDEIDTHDITAKALKSGKPPLPKGITEKLQKSGGEIIGIGIRLREKMFDPGDGSEPVPLFTPPELQAEFYTPVMRERIFPEGFIADPFSATQQMIDETNALLLEMTERKRLAGELTPEIDLVKVGIESGAKLLAAGSSMLGGLSGADVETAKMILETGSDVLTGIAEVRGQVKEGKFADAASAALDIAGTLTGAALAAAGVDSTICKITTGAIGTGSSAVLLGKVLNQVRNGEADISQALAQMGDVIGKGLATGAEGASGGTAKALQIAAKAAPAIFLAVGKGSELPKKVHDGDYKGVIDTLTEITKAVLDQIPGLEKVGGTVDPQELAQLGADALNLTIKTVFAVKKGEYLGALNGAITDIGASLGTVLSAAGVDDTLSGQIVKLYKGAASAPKALELLRQDPPKVDAAVKELAGGIESALSGTGNEVLTTVGESLALGIKSLVTADQVRKLYQANDFDGAVELVADNLSEGFDKLAGALGIEMPDDEEEDDDGGDEAQDKDDGGKPRAKREAPTPDQGAVAELKKVAAKLKDLQVNPKLIEEATALLQKKQDAEQELADIAEAEEMLAQAQAEENALSEAELAGAEASNIEQLINDLLRERMVLKLATQIATGGASFLAQFLPGLGAASAGIKLAAALYAAGQRAKQLDAWMKSQKDLQNAQSALSSSAANFVKNQGQQLAHYSAQAFFAATQLAGEIAKLAGPASGAGAIISAAAAAGAKIEEIVMDAKNSYDVEAGWKATQKALQNPGNRRLGLEARRLNPTLAKYSMAWGAVVLKDPLARGAMKACGLTEAALKSADEAEGAHLVVKYLETFYEDDVTIYRDSNVEPPKWVPAEIEISLVCWASFRRGAQGATLTLAKAGLVEGLLGEYDGVQSRAEETGATLQARQQALTLATQALKASTELALKTTGVDVSLPVLPDTTALTDAIDAHTESLRIRSETAQRLYFALLEVEPGAADTQKAKTDLDAAKAALKSFQSKANRVNEAAAQDAEGLKEAKLQIQTRVASMSLDIETAKAKKLKETQAKTPKPEPEPVAG